MKKSTTENSNWSKTFSPFRQQKLTLARFGAHDSCTFYFLLFTCFQSCQQSLKGDEIDLPRPGPRRRDLFAQSFNPWNSKSYGVFFCDVYSTNEEIETSRVAEIVENLKFQNSFFQSN